MSEPPVSSSGGLLNDLPEASIGGAKKNGSARPALGDAPGEMTAMHGPKNPYIANPGATYSSPAVTQYRPPGEGGNKTAIIAIVAFAGVAVLGIGAFVLVSLNQPKVVQTPVAPNPPVVPPVAPQQNTTGQPTPPPTNQIKTDT